MGKPIKNKLLTKLKNKFKKTSRGKAPLKKGRLRGVSRIMKPSTRGKVRRMLALEIVKTDNAPKRSKWKERVLLVNAVRGIIQFVIELFFL